MNRKRKENKLSKSSADKQRDGKRVERGIRISSFVKIIRKSQLDGSRIFLTTNIPNSRYAVKNENRMKISTVETPIWANVKLIKLNTI